MEYYAEDKEKETELLTYWRPICFLYLIWKFAKEQRLVMQRQPPYAKLITSLKWKE